MGGGGKKEIPPRGLESDGVSRRAVMFISRNPMEEPPPVECYYVSVREGGDPPPARQQGQDQGVHCKCMTNSIGTPTQEKYNWFKKKYE